MKLVFYKQSFQWPLRQGAAVHSGNLMRELARRGHQVELWTKTPVSKEVSTWLAGVECTSIVPTADSKISMSWWAERFRRYWGEDKQLIAALSSRVEDDQPDAIIGVGPEVLPALSQCGSSKRIWYAADDPVLHQLSLGGLKSMKPAAAMAVYESVLANQVDATWVVSGKDRRWSRLFGRGRVDWLPNGVDLDHYQPIGGQTQPQTCIFWGNLSFQPNDDAATYLINEIWPQVLSKVPDAQLWVCGCMPSEKLRSAMHSTTGVTFFEDLPDLREKIAQAQVTVFPLISGAGVKNKLLEAAALAKPILASPRCMLGLAGDEIPVKICKRTNNWASEIAGLWSNEETRRLLGDQSRQWVQTNHQWAHTAKLAEQLLQEIG